MYQKYHTDALVIGGRSLGESDKLLTLFTRDFGLVRARATALRKERSRMRYAVSELSFAHVSLVQGLRGWRLAGASPRRAFGASDIRAAGAWARIAQLVERLVKGEEANLYLFSTLLDAHAALSESVGDICATIELVCVARVLYALGYLSKDVLDTAPARAGLPVRGTQTGTHLPARSAQAGAGGLFTHTAYTMPDLEEAQAKREPLLFSVNKALSETQL